MKNRTTPVRSPKNYYPSRPSSNRVVTGGFSSSNRRRLKRAQIKNGKDSEVGTCREKAEEKDSRDENDFDTPPSKDQLASLFRDARTRIISKGGGTEEEDICKRLEAAAKYTAAVIDTIETYQTISQSDLSRSVRSWHDSQPDKDSSYQSPWSGYGSSWKHENGHSKFVQSLSENYDDTLTNFFLYNYADLESSACAQYETLKANEKELETSALATNHPVTSTDVSNFGRGNQHIEAYKQNTVTALCLPKKTIENVKTTSEMILKLLRDWDFDIFSLNENIVNNEVNCYVIVGNGIVQHINGLITKLGFDHSKFTCMLKELAEGYSDNPYHNCLHGADVCQALGWALGQGGVARAFSGAPVVVGDDTAPESDSKSEIPSTTYLAALLAALAHDVGHPGVNNNYLVATAHEWALRYNDQSPLEHMHAATLFTIMARDRANFLTCDKNTRRAMRGIIIDMILSTDMVKHAGLLNKLHSRIEDRGHELCSEPGDIHLVLNICLHLADISNPARPIDVAVRWAKRIQEEFWHQGDLMREQAMDVPAMHDRAHAGANVTFESQSQIGFTQFLVKPLGLCVPVTASHRIRIAMCIIYYIIYLFIYYTKRRYNFILAIHLCTYYLCHFE